jgi:phospholipid/cholesterol/gamma-HCH transport system substrate-binding protein
VKLAIKKHWRDFLALIGLVVIGLAVAVYVLSQQDFRFPLVETSPKKISIELENAQAVEPGQGQTVRVAGVEVGRIADVKLENGRAVVQIEVEPKYDNLIREDATALLRPKTALKDMFVEVSPGTGKVVPDGGRIGVANTLPDVDPD